MDLLPGRYILTGSANLLLMKSVSESLAGRAAYLSLWPMTRRERLGQGRVCHAGDAVEWLGPRILAAPWWRVI